MVLFISPRGIRSMQDREKTAVTVVPFSGFDQMEKLPPVISAAYLKNGMPSPTFLVDLVVKNGSVTRNKVSSVMPFPSSVMTVVRRSFLSSTQTRREIREAPARREFSAASRICNEISFIIYRLNYSYLARMSGTSSAVSLP